MTLLVEIGNNGTARENILYPLFINWGVNKFFIPFYIYFLSQFLRFTSIFISEW